MNHLFYSFQENQGLRGCHFYDDEKCSFLPWDGVLVFLEKFKLNTDCSSKEQFCDLVLSAMSNYNPDYEFLAVRQFGANVSVELYSNHERYSRV